MKDKLKDNLYRKSNIFGVRTLLITMPTLFRLKIEDVDGELKEAEEKYDALSDRRSGAEVFELGLDVQKIKFKIKVFYELITE